MFQDVPRQPGSCRLLRLYCGGCATFSSLSFPKDVEVVSLMAGLYPQQLRELCGDIPISVVIPSRGKTGKSPGFCGGFLLFHQVARKLTV
jgi:hypothetical protein